MSTIPGDSSSTTNAVVGGAVTAYSLDNATDQDWFRLVATAGKVYTIRLIGAGTGTFTLTDPMIDGIYSGGTYVAGYNNEGLWAGPNGRDAMTVFTAPSSITYHIAVAGDSGATGSYALVVYDSSGGTDGTITGTTATTGTIAVNGTTDATIDNATDIDWFKTTTSLSASTTYRIRLVGTTYPVDIGKTLWDGVIYGVYDSAGNKVPNTYVDDFDTRNPELTFKPPADGIYYISAGGAGGATGSYRLYLDSTGVTPDVGSGTTSGTSSTITINGSASVAVNQAFDHDRYSVALTQNITYQITLTGTTINSTPTINGIYDSSGNYLDGFAPAVRSGQTSTATTIFTPSAGGTYYIDAFSNAPGTYSLTLTQLGTADVAATTATTATMTVGTPYNGDTGSATDTDWIKVSLTGGNIYTVQLQGSYRSNGTLSDPTILGIYDASGTLISGTYADDQDGSDASVTFRPSTAGANNYFIAAAGFGSAIGTYKLSVSQLAGDVGQTAATSTAAAAFGSSVSGNIGDPSDADWYSMTLVAGTTYYVRMRGTDSGNGTLADPLITSLYNSSGVAIANTSADDIGGIRDASVIYTATAGGAYYAALEGYDDSTGSFALLVENEAGQTAATAWAMPDSGAAGGTIDSGTDVDWYRYTLKSNTSYVFKMHGSGAMAAMTLSDPVISAIYNNAATPAAQTIATSISTLEKTYSARFAPSSAGDYYVEMKRTAGTTTGTYHLVITPEAGGTMATAFMTNVNTTTSGAIDDTTDTDWYGVNLTANTSYVFKMLGLSSSNGTLDDPHITGVINSAGTNQTTGLTSSSVVKDAVVRFVPGATDTYYVQTTLAASTTIGTYKFIAQAEPGASIATAWTMSSGTSVSGEIDDATDVDWYKINLTANTAYVFKMLGTYSGKGSLADPNIVEVINGSSAVQTITNSSVGTDAVVRFVPTVTTDYYIKAGITGTAVGTYLLTAEAEAGSSTTAAMTVAVGGSVSAAIDDATDTDWYKVTLTANTGYVFKMLGTSSSNGTLADPNIIEVINAGGTVQTITNSSVGTDAIVRFVPTASADYYVKGSITGTAIGTYVFSAATDAADTNATAIALTLGNSLSGSIDDATDTDWYAVTLTANTTYRIDVMGADSKSGTLIDPYINTIRTAGGATAVAATDGGGVGRDARVSFTPTATGTYYIVVDNGVSNSTATGSYLVRVSQSNQLPLSMIEPDAVITDATDVPLTLTGIPITEFWM